MCLLCDQATYRKSPELTHPRGQVTPDEQRARLPRPAGSHAAANGSVSVGPLTAGY